MNQQYLEDRLVKFSGDIIFLTKEVSNSYSGEYLSKQMIRSSASSALNYGEARGAETKKDFIHKLTISLKEIRETYVTLKIIAYTQQCRDEQFLRKALNECNELISIFVSTIKKLKTTN